jgi:hypothetical protein
MPERRAKQLLPLVRILAITDGELQMKRTREITIILYRRRRVKKHQAGLPDGCPLCGSDLLEVSAAAKLADMSNQALCDWITSDHVHATPAGGRQLRVCRRSLLERIAANGRGERACPKLITNQVNRRKE